MGLHFLLKAEARSLSVVQVLAMGDDEALALFRQLRWGEGEQVVCPHCGMAHRHYFRPTRKIWRSAGWQDDFSVTSGTIFAFHKLPLRLYLAAAILFTNAVKGISALPVGRDLGVSHKTAYVLLHKILQSGTLTLYASVDTQRSRMPWNVSPSRDTTATFFWGCKSSALIRPGNGAHPATHTQTNTALKVARPVRGARGLKRVRFRANQEITH